MSEKYPRIILPPVTPTEAISEAMTWAVSQTFKAKHFANRDLEPFLDYLAQKNVDSPLEIIRLFTQNTTSGFCREQSLYVIYHLHRNFPRLFRRYFLLESHRSDSDTPFRRENWFYHSCFLLEDVDHLYHTGSPANYTPTAEDDENSLNRFFSSARLDELIDQLTAYKKGIWPDPHLLRLNLYHDAGTKVKKVFLESRLPDFQFFEVATLSRDEYGRLHCQPKEKYGLRLPPDEDFVDLVPKKHSAAG